MTSKILLLSLSLLSFTVACGKKSSDDAKDANNNDAPSDSTIKNTGNAIPNNPGKSPIHFCTVFYVTCPNKVEPVTCTIDHQKVSGGSEVITFSGGNECKAQLALRTLMCNDPAYAPYYKDGDYTPKLGTRKCTSTAQPKPAE